MENTDLIFQTTLTRIAISTFGKKNKIVRKIAPEGKIFLVVSCKFRSKSGGTKISKNFPILIGTPQDQIDSMAKIMEEQIKKQFNL